MDSQVFKNIMSRWLTGISVITTNYEGEIQGFTANSFASVSIDPFLISMSVGKTLYAGDLIQKSGTFAINILTKDQAEWGKLFAGFYSDRENRFENIVYSTTKSGNPILPGVFAWMDCRIYQTVDVGASTLILGEVTDGSFSVEGEPLAYFHRQWGHFVADE
ncbi:flavin reductase family protein [Phototrophicus methaneseepsis]|uniref:Flavin reductase family protein n=1 Tax=Phototrophicus methaneseepsis TaxID=2710758 RepID=A0A7S8E6E9_9CHLR|nr:flavin reductase family protein [Phototrophicus methaneseepsis]QPC81170.1 flavin reductase family protein [Phototrophicus methaneseepsis]